MIDPQARAGNSQTGCTCSFTKIQIPSATPGGESSSPLVLPQPPSRNNGPAAGTHQRRARGTGVPVAETRAAGAGPEHQQEGATLLLERLGRGLVTHFRLRGGAAGAEGECGAAAGGGGALAGNCGCGGDAPPVPGGGGRAVVRGPIAPVLDSRFGLGDRIGRRSVDSCHSHEAPHCLRGRCQ